MDLSSLSDEELMAQLGSSDVSSLSDEELMAQLGQPTKTPEKQSFARDVVTGAIGVPETALTLASSTVAEPIAGLAGIVGTVLPGERGQGARFVESTRGALTFEPRSEPGKQLLQKTGEALSPVGEFVEGGRKAVGDAAFNAAGGDDAGAALAGTAGQASFDAALMALPFIGQALKKTKNAVLQSQRASIGRKIRAKVPDVDTARFDLNAAGNVVKSSARKTAISQGFDEGVIAALHAADDADLISMLKMTNVSEKGAKNALFRETNRPGAVVGESLSKRLTYIRKINKQAGSEVGKAVDDLAGARVDVTSAVDNFIDDLAGAGVKMDPVTRKLNFRGSDFDMVGGSEKALNRMVKRMLRDDKGPPTAADAHRLKKWIDENVVYGKKKQGLGGQAERILKDLRHNLNESLQDQFPSYKQANVKYSDTIKALDDFQSAAGSKIELFGPNADASLGTVARKLTSNYQSRIQLTDAMQTIEDIATKYGAHLDDSVVLQNMFATELDTVFGAAARTSLQAEIEKGVGRLAKSGIREAATDGALSAGKKLLGKTDAKAYEAMRNLLKEQLKLRRQQRPKTSPGKQIAPRVENP